MKRYMLAFLFLSINTTYLLCYELPIVVYPRQIKFNYESSNNYDAVDIRKNHNEDIPVPEWVHNDRNERFAYIMNASNRRIEASIYSNCSPVDLYITVTETSGVGLGDIEPYTVDTYIPTADNYITLTTEGTIPNSVGIRNFTWEWYIEAENTYGVWPYEESGSAMEYTSHTYYTLLGTPQAPMTEPWADALDYACDWASGENIEVGIVSGLSTGAYYSFPIYNATYTHSSPPYCGLTALLQILGGFSQPVDCQDVSATVYIFAKALGVASVQIKRISDGGSGYNFHTKSISVLGGPWSTYEFGMHQIVYLLGVFDPTNRLQNPIRIPIKEDMYNNYKLDFYDNGYWDPVLVSEYTQVD